MTDETPPPPPKNPRKPFVKSKFEGFVYAFLTVVIILRFIGAYEEARQRHGGIMQPTPAPSFTWRDFDGAKHDIKELSGKVVVLHFWASWCGPCREEFPALLRAADRLKDDAVFLTLSGDEDDIQARKFIATAKSAAGVAPDNVLYGFDGMKSVIYDIFQTTAFPESFVIDPRQNLRRKLTGTQNWGDPKLITYIRDIKTQPLPKPTAASQVPTVP